MLKIFTLHWNKKDIIGKLKDSLIPAIADIEFEWYIKDNASNDGSKEEIKQWNDERIKLIEYPHNKDSYAQGMNFLFKESSPKNDDLILMLNNDITFNDNKSIKNMIKIIEENKNVGLVGAKLNYTGTNKIQHCGVLFHKSNGLPFHFRANEEEQERDRLNRYYPAVTGALTLTTGDIYKNTMMDCKYIWAFEDIDFSCSIHHNLKKAIVYCGETSICHEESSSLKKNPVNKLFMNHNAKTFLEKWHRVINVKLVDNYNDPNYNLYKGKQ